MTDKDPLLKASESAQRELFSRICREANGFSNEAAIGAAMNLIINSLRQTYPKREAAEQRYDEIATRMKAVMMDHYDSAGRKRGIFPYDQLIHVPHIDLQSKVN